MYDDFDDFDEDYDEFDQYGEAKRGCRELEAARSNFLAVEKAEYDRRLDELRKQPNPNGYALATAEGTAWMTEDERNCVEWFDRQDYDTFMKRSAWYEGDGWIVPYCRLLCDARNLADEEILSGYANDGGALRIDRFMCVVDKMFEDAKAGNARAQNSVGIICEKGLPYIDEKGHPLIDETFLKEHFGVESKEAAMREWYGKSAAGGCFQGIRNYARLLREGIGGGWRLPDGSYDRAKVLKDKADAEKWYGVAADRGDGGSRYVLACMFAQDDDYPMDADKCSKWLLLAAEAGHPKAKKAVAAAGNDVSPERLCAELLILLYEERAQRQDVYPKLYYDFSINVPDRRKKPKEEPEEEPEEDWTEWLKEQVPEGTVVPPPASRETVRTPNLNSPNPSFAARLIIFVRDRFNGDAPSVYRAAHVSRKTYSAIVSNELRPVSKPTAVSLALALKLEMPEFCGFLESAGYALSDYLLDDIIVNACVMSKIYDVAKVNEILEAHGADPLGKPE